MIQLSSIQQDCTSYDISKDSSTVAFSKGYVVRLLHTKDFSPISEFTFPEEVVQVQISDDCQKVLAINKYVTLTQRLHRPLRSGHLRPHF